MISAILVSVAFAIPGQLVPNTSIPAGPTSPATTVTLDAEQRRGQPVEQRESPTGERPHTVGFGGQLAISNRGAGAGARLFFGERVGVNLNAFWYRGNARYTTVGPEPGSTYGAFPSVIIMLTKPDPTRDVDIRPYIGGGVSYVSASRRVTAGGLSEYQRVGGTGGQAFGGVEMTFREADWMTISAEGIYYRLPVRFVNTSVVDGFNYLLAFHFYLK